MWYWQEMGSWGQAMMVIFWVGVLLVILWAARSATTDETPESTPFQVLGERLARGEIDREDYQERRTLLERQR